MRTIYLFILVIGFLAFTCPYADGQIDVLNKGKNLIKDKTKKDDNNNQNNNVNNNVNNNENNNVNNNENNNVNSNEPIDDCKKARNRCGYDLDFANQYADKSDWGQVDFNLEKVEDNIKFIKENCPSQDVSDLEAKVKAVKDKKENIVKNAANDEERWKKDDAWMQSYKDWTYKIIDYYLGSPDIGSPLRTTRGFAELLGTRDAYDKKKATADSIIKQWPVEKLNYSSLWSNYSFATTHFMKMWDDRLNSGFDGYLQKCFDEIDRIKNIPNQQPYLYFQAAEKMYTIASAASLFGDPNGKLTNFLSDAKSYREKYIAEMRTKIYTSDLHEKNAERILFSNTPITIKQENPNSFDTEFKAGERIYAMAYSNYILNYTYKVQIYIDDMDHPKYACDYFIKPTSGDAWFAIDIVPITESFRQYQSADWTRILSELTPREHKIGFQLITGGEGAGFERAWGEFTVDCSQNLEQWESLAKEFAEKAIDMARMPIAELKNPTLEQSFINAFKKANPDLTPLRIVLLEKDWSVYKNEITNKPEYRSIYTAIAIKQADGKCLVYNNAIFSQDYNGSAYAPVEYVGATESYEIRQENVNK